MFVGRLAVAEYFHVNKIDWPVVGCFAAYAVVAVVVVAAAAVAALVNFDIDQLDTCDTD